MGIKTKEAIGIETANDTQLQYYDGKWQSVLTEMPEEANLPIFINGQEVVSILCTPNKLNCLVIGYLMSQGFINNLGDIAMMRICSEELLADVKSNVPLAIPGKRTLTSGCGGGVSFEQGLEPSVVRSQRNFSPQQILSSIRMLLQWDKTSQNGGRHGGMHVAALSDGENLLAVSRDIGRHNTLDKIWGECLLRKIATDGLILVSTGRISSDMLFKAVKMGVVAIVSINSATIRAVELGNRFGVTIIGYARGNQFTIFCGKERIADSPWKLVQSM